MTKKIALVTGGSRGLGKDMALKIAARGLDVILTYQSNENLAHETVEEIKKTGGRAAVLHLDMNNFNSLDMFVASFKSVIKSEFGAQSFDYLVHNAGMGKTVPFAEVSEALFDEFMNVHYKGVFFLTQKLVTVMNDGGGIINISSGTTRFANPGYSVYASMKGAIETLTKYFAKELGSKGIRANVIAPGPIETDFNNGAIRNNPQLKGILSNMSPLGRVGNAEDIGGVVAFLCTDDSRWINGQRIEVSGGINV